VDLESNNTFSKIIDLTEEIVSTRMVLILAGALFYATVTFSSFRFFVVSKSTLS
jgi:hypothetical protein